MLGFSKPMQQVKINNHANIGDIYINAKFPKASLESNETILNGKWNLLLCWYMFYPQFLKASYIYKTKLEALWLVM